MPDWFQLFTMASEFAVVSSLDLWTAMVALLGITFITAGTGVLVNFIFSARPGGSVMPDSKAGEGDRYDVMDLTSGFGEGKRSRSTAYDDDREYDSRYAFQQKINRNVKSKRWG